MKILLKYLLQNAAERKMQTAVMLLSILLSTTLLFVSFSISASYESAQQKMARGLYGSATISITSEDGILDPDEMPTLSSVGAMAGIGKGSALYHENGYYETIDLLAADLAQLDQINPPRLLGRGEISNFTGNQVILPDRFTSKFGFQQDDMITLQIEGQPVSFQVAAIAAYDTVFLRHTRGATALLPLSTWAELLGQPEGYQEILVKPAEGVTTAALQNALAAALPESYHVSEAVKEGQIAADARQKTMPFFLVSFFSLTMSVFLINSSYKVITLDRLPIIGTFRSIGATQKAVTRVLLLESVLYGVIGGLAGIFAGGLALRLILRGLGQSLSMGIEIPVVISPRGIVVSFTVALLASLLSAWLPVHRASRLTVNDVVLGVVEEPPPPRRWTVGAGALLLILSVFLPRAASGNLLYLAGGCSLLGLIAAAILLIPPLVNLLSWVLERLYGLILGNEGRLAARNMRDNKYITQNITLLFISISALIAISVVSEFVTTYVSDVFDGAELEGFADGYMEQDFVDQVKAMEGVEKVLPLHVMEQQVQAGDVPIPRLEATDNLAWYSAMLALHFTQDNQFEQAISAFATDRSVLLSKRFMERLDIAPGDTLLLSSQAGQYAYEVVGSFQSRATDVDAVIPSSYAVSDFGASAYDFLAYTAADPEAIMVQIRSLFGSVDNWSRTVEEFNADAHATVSAFLQPMGSMTYFILLLAMVGVTNNLLINYMQKRRAIAMYQSVGLSRRQQLKMTLLEGGTSGLIGGIMAMVISYLEIQTIFLVAGPKIAMAPKLTAAAFLTAAAMGLVVTMLGSIVPIMKTRNMNLVAEIK